MSHPPSAWIHVRLKEPFAFSWLLALEPDIQALRVVPGYALMFRLHATTPDAFEARLHDLACRYGLPALHEQEMICQRIASKPCATPWGGRPSHHASPTSITRIASMQRAKGEERKRS